MTGQETTLGDAIVKAKSHIGDPDVRRTFVLLGDPAMQVKRPSQNGTAH
jgi:UTP-glucose-1-phosphate uridylyltransferase